MYGDRDRTVKPRNIKNLAAAVLREHGRVRTIYYAGLGHIDIIGAPSIALRSRAPVLDDLAIFIDNKTGTLRP